MKRSKASIPARTIPDTMRPDMVTPAKTASIVLLRLRPRIQAPRVPVQAPVIGSGMPTKTATPQKPKRSTLAHDFESSPFYQSIEDSGIETPLIEYLMGGIKE
jgi:hypothetical protein